MDVSFMDLDGARAAFRKVGAGPPLLLIHGWPLHGLTFRGLLPALSSRYTCYVVDLPGAGESEWSDRMDLSAHGHARWLERFLHAAGVGRVSLLAFDNGGTAARLLAVSLGARVEALVLSNTEMPGHRPPWVPLYKRLLGMPGATATFRALLRLRAFRRSRLGYGGCFVDRSLIDGEFHQLFVAPLLEQPRALEGQLRILDALQWSVLDQMADLHGRIAAPVKLIWGADDVTFPLDHARRMRFPRQEDLAEIRGGALLVHEEKPAEYLAAALPFLDRCRGQGGAAQP